jgi:hypothetical protein
MSDVITKEKMKVLMDLDAQDVLEKVSAYDTFLDADYWRLTKRYNRLFKNDHNMKLMEVALLQPGKKYYES